MLLDTLRTRSMKKKHDFLFLLTLVTDTFTITNNDDFGITCDRKSCIYEI